MLALIAGTGDLPPAIVARCTSPVLVCAMDGFSPSVPVDVSFRIEHLGCFLAELKARGVTTICMAGAVRRPVIDPSQIDALTLPLVPKIQLAMSQGDDGALRAVIGIFEQHGFDVSAAHEIVPELLPKAGLLTAAHPSTSAMADAQKGDSVLVEMGANDSGQACIIRDGQVLSREGSEGTDAMIIQVGRKATGGILHKGPKPNQDRRADLPVIGPATAQAVVEAGLAGIVIAADGVMVLDQARVVDLLNAAGKFLWARDGGSS